MASPDVPWLVGAFSPDGTRVAATCPDLKIRVWETDTGRLVSTARDYTTVWKNGVAFSPDGSRLVTLGLNAQVWDVETGRAVVPGDLFRYTPMAAAFSPDGRTLYLLRRTAFSSPTTTRAFVPRRRLLPVPALASPTQPGSAARVVAPGVAGRAGLQ